MPSGENVNEINNHVEVQAAKATLREDDLIHNDPNPGLRFSIKAFFAQLFKGNKSDAINSRLAVKGDLDNVQTDYNLQNMSTNQRCEKSFENFYSLDEKDKQDIKSLKDANELGQSLTSTKARDREREGGFYKLVSEPLNRLADLEEGSEEYNKLKDKLLNNLDKYMDSHNPSSKIGKARCEFAQRLRFALSKENELDEDEIEDDIEDDMEDVNENDVEENKNKGFLDNCHIVEDKEKISLAKLEKEERTKDVGVTKRVNREAPEKEAEKSM